MKAIITGASKGIGKAIAFKLASDGIHLILTARNFSELDLLKQEIHKEHPNIQVSIYTADLSNRAEVEKLIEDVFAQHQDLNILINNAGIYKQGDISNGDESILEEMMEVNLYAPIHISRGLLPILQKNKGSHIFNICSIAGLDPYPRAGMYSISKFAMQGFSRCLREELKEKGIKVCTIYPGATWSNSWEGSDLPASRIMQASDVAEVISMSIKLSPSAVLEEITLRPQLGDLP
ncbi:MAG: SDR family oxidoreductase [Saprospiraceae bacterium]|nr:SDR family oxidoreductase [Saprospiraceae bacterium]MBK9630103.1 SDR family oxidoreductase [Saprospiraceae bacterium]